MAAEVQAADVAIPAVGEPAALGGKLSDPDWAWARYEPDPDRPWSLARAGHLLRRATLGPRWDELQRAVAEGPQRTVDRLLRPEGDLEAFDRELAGYEDAEARAGSRDGLRAWWLRRCLRSPHALLEALTLFWHDHFAAELDRVADAGLLLQRVRLLRRHALGDFRELLEGIARDPAMLVGLDSSANRKARPNDHLARRFLEVFTLGPGNFSEQDVREMARAFTGWFVLRGELRYISREHDGGEKRLLGREGRFGDREVVRILADELATSRLVARKLFRQLVSETVEPTAELIEPIAQELRDTRGTARVVETILRSNLFHSEAAYRRRIKSPLEYAVGIIRPLEGLVATAPLGQHLADLGQDLYRPPSVEGWPGARAWVHPFSLVGRHNLAASLLGTEGPYEGQLDPEAVAGKHGHVEVSRAARFLVDLLLQGDLPEEASRRLLDGANGESPSRQLPSGVRLRRLGHQIASLPEFHVS